MKRILVATDLSSRSELAVMRAAALAKARNAELTVRTCSTTTSRRC
ncbi:universal stress protein [Pseudomonas aeruginosa]|nr:universal stress protein [Pseudomonas aeruginosa]